VTTKAWDVVSRLTCNCAGVRIPLGIVVPWLLDGELWQLKIRTN
jgi:hypothetical protein